VLLAMHRPSPTPSGVGRTATRHGVQRHAFAAAGRRPHQPFFARHSGFLFGIVVRFATGFRVAAGGSACERKDGGFKVRRERFSREGKLLAPSLANG